MFLTHFKMTEIPFSEKPPIDGILKDDRISQGLANVGYLASNATFGLITGIAGVGKSSSDEIGHFYGHFLKFSVDTF
jgi:hypothetical protein